MLKPSQAFGARLKSAAFAVLGAGMVSVAALSLAATAVAEPVSIEALAQFESLTSVDISPDGKRIVGLLAVKGQKWPLISIWDAQDLSKAPVWIPSATNRIIAVGFFDNERIYFYDEQEITRYDGRLSFTNKLYMADVEGKKIEEPFKTTGTRNKEVQEQMSRGVSTSIFNDGLYNQDLVLLSRVDPESLANEIVEYNKKTGAMRVIAKESEKYSFLPAGVNLTTGVPMIRQAVKVKGDGKFYLLTEVRDPTTDQWMDHPELGFLLEQRVDLTILGFDTDPNKLFVRTNRGGRNNSAIYSYDLVSKTYSAEPLFANDQFDIVGISLKQNYAEKKVDSVFGITVGGPNNIQVILDEQWAATQASIKAAFPGKNVTLGVNRKQGSAVVTVEAPNFPPEYYLFSGGKLAKLGAERPWINPETLGKAEFVSFKARDGLDIPAIVTYPPAWTPEKGPVPVVVLPHGGPWARDYLSWDGSGWPQFLATRGIVVIQPQYRGSDGLGDKLWKAGDGEWGQKMSDDNDDAAAYLVSKGVGDPKRMAIFGYSYGGFAAIAASVRPNSPYRCAIAGAGVSSLERLGNVWGESRLSRDIQGHTVKGMDPLKNVDKANIPILLYHGDRDRQADTDHSRLFYKAMKSAGKDVQYIEIKDMWHTLPWRPEWHTQSLGAIEKFLKSDKCGLL